jgi:hypothetical protein
MTNPERDFDTAEPAALLFIVTDANCLPRRPLLRNCELYVLTSAAKGDGTTAWRTSEKPQYYGKSLRFEPSSSGEGRANSL